MSLMERRTTSRNVSRPNRFFTQTEAADFLKQHSVYPSFINTEMIMLLLLQVEMSVEEMPPSDRDYHISTKRAFHHSATMQPFDLDIVSNEMQHLAGIDISLLGSMAQVTVKFLPFPSFPHALLSASLLLLIWCR